MTAEIDPYGQRLSSYPVLSRLHWPSIVAGAFVAMALLIVSVLLARGCDVDVTFRNSATMTNEVGAIIWGGIAALICFGIGGTVAGRNAVMSGRSGLINGFMVWAVLIPILVYGLNSGIGPRLGQTVALGGGKALMTGALSAPQFGAAAVTASERIETPDVLNNENNATAGEPRQAAYAGETNGIGTPVSHAIGAAWWTLCSIGLGLLGAAACGAAAGSPEQRRIA